MTRWVTSDLFLKTLCQLKGFLILLHLHNWNCKLDPHFPCVSQRVNCNFAAHLLLLQTYPKPCCWSQCIYELLCTIYDSLMVTASTPTCTKLKALVSVSSSASLLLRTFIVSAKAVSSPFYCCFCCAVFEKSLSAKKLPQWSSWAQLKLPAWSPFSLRVSKSTASAHMVFILRKKVEVFAAEVFRNHEVNCNHLNHFRNTK